MSLPGSGILNRSDTDLSAAVRKACSIEVTAPKRKHVRACIIYTHDHRSSRAFWNALKVQPIHSSEVQVFKSLILIHKVLQEGHVSALREAQNQIPWLESLRREARREFGPSNGSAAGYGKLIYEYVGLLLKKLDFHAHNPLFNGTFEYEEYISLRSVNDPNEGYEIIINLMDLQDAIDRFQGLIFASIRNQPNNECKISALTPLVSESYGIYRFITSMLRAMHQTTGDDSALAPLRERYYAQYNELVNFYYDCSTLKYLTSIITIPKLNPTPPNLYGDDDDDEFGPSLPHRPALEHQTGASAAPSKASTPAPAPAEPIDNSWWQQSQAQYEAEQQRLALEREAEIQRQQQLASEQQAQYEAQQRALAEQQRQAEAALYQDQLQRQAQGRVADLERDLLALNGQYEQAQMLLQQYDNRMKSLEGELAQANANTEMQLNSKNELIQSLQDQVQMWKSKYESLAKLYSQLRQEHLDLLAKHKDVRARASSAQEAIDKRERLEKDLKAKNLELADLIRERDRARYDLDRLRGNERDIKEKHEREMRMLQEKLDAAEKSKGSDLSSMMAMHQKEIANLEEALRAKQAAFDSRGIDSASAKEKDDEIDILKETVNSMEQALKDMSLEKSAADSAMDEQIDRILLEQLDKLASIIDAILRSGAERIQEALYEYDSPMQAGNQNSTPQYLLSVIEKTSSAATDFSTSFNNFLADGPNGDQSAVIKDVIIFSSSISDVLINSKGIIRLARDDRTADAIDGCAREAALSAGRFFTGLYSSNIKDLSTEDKTDQVITSNIEVQTQLQQLSKLAEKLSPKSNLLKGAEDLGTLVDNEMSKAADAISKANQKLSELLSKPRDPRFSSIDVAVHEAILQAAMAVTAAIGALIQAAIECQEEIVSQGRGTSSKTQFYKKNNRWTEGLISAAKAVASSTNILIETASGVLGSKNSPEQLIVASNEVAASTAQLVAASRVKASFMSQTQDKLEKASKTVTSACRGLVNQVQDILAKKHFADEEDVDYAKLSAHEFRTKDMEQQVEVLKLENELAQARKRLGEIRKVSYMHSVDEDDDDGA